MTRRWNGVLARMGVPTGDGRILVPGGGSSRSLPLPLMWQPTSNEGHGGAHVVGRIETMAFTDGMVTATGSILESADYSLGVIEQLEAGVIGPSVDLDDIEYTVDEAGNLVITRWRVAGATLVAIPAFEGVNVTLDPMPAPDMPGEDWWADSVIMASVRSSGWSDMPIADEGRAWDGSAAANRVLAWATEGDTTNWSKYARAFLRKDDDANPETRGAYGFGIADVIDGTLTIVPRGVFAAAAAVEGARTGSAPKDAEGMKQVLRSIYARMDREAPFSLGVTEVTASAAPVLPPSSWFMKPDLDRLTPITVSDTGRVFGHIADWETCHVGLPGCVTAPFSPSGYAYFHVASQRTQDGLTLPVGTLVAGPRHADPQLAFQAAQQHYDDPTAMAAKVVAGEDDYGIWVAGWMPPEVTEVTRTTFLSSPVSGDWRRIGGNLELVAVCSVNTPGFPVPRARVAFSLGEQQALIASSGLTPQVEARVEVTEGTNASSLQARAKWAWATTGMEG